MTFMSAKAILRRLAMVLCLSATIAGTADGAVHWTSYRGPTDQGLCDSPGSADPLERARERGLEDAHCGQGMVIAGDLGRPDLADHRFGGRDSADGPLRR